METGVPSTKGEIGVPGLAVELVGVPIEVLLSKFRRFCWRTVVVDVDEETG